MLTLSEISKSFGGRTLFSDVSLQVNRGDRIGLVGPNGAGKSTLFSLILQTDTPDDGQVNFERGITLGFLPQESEPAGDETVVELAMAITPDFVELSRKLKAWDTTHPDDLDPNDDIHSRYNELGGYQIESRAKSILKGLSFRDSDFDRPAREMSGGWVMRAHLARLLTQEPDLLMLDEPTNHLDLEALLWFQEYLKGYPGGVLMISHDREFLNQLVGSILDIRHGKLTRYRGNYEDYLALRAAKDAQQLSAYKNQQKEIAHLQEFADRFRAKASKAAPAQSKLKQIERMEKIEAPVADDATVGFSFPQPQRSGLKVVSLKEVGFSYGNTPVYRNLDFQAERDDRTVLVGPNGAGKSTLLKLLAGVLTPQTGERVLGHNAQSGYFSQYRTETLDMSRTVLDEASDTPQRVTEQYIRTVLGSFLFRGDDVFKRVSVLSGGEKSRLALVKLLLNPPNLLLMDEPTTHLDMASIDALVKALKEYTGTLIFISHDVYFIRALANKVLHVNAGVLTPYAGDYQYYLDKTQATSARVALTAGLSDARPAQQREPARRAPMPGVDRKEQKRLEAAQRQGRSSERKSLQQLVHRLEKDIADCEARQSDLTLEMEKPETYAKAGAAMHLNRELMGVQHQLETLTADWETAAKKLAEMDASA
ncbi:MAG: ABC-F family ATP-binding cassette domain-containing protein [Verrucomicrobia bacterium]|nr:ABC-F family ATP-binding cassette domain-containing protein [Verrucomicrobiota bacterium]